MLIKCFHFKSSSISTRLITEMCVVTFLERHLLIQYLHAKTFLHGAFDHILKVVDTYSVEKVLKNCG